MRFTVGGYRRMYVLNPQLRDLVAAGNGVARRDITGLTVSSNNTRTIDTDREAKAYGWSEEEQEAMEKLLLSHPDFGTKIIVDSGQQRGDELLNAQVWNLWFAADQDIPPKYQAFCEQQSWYQAWDMAEAMAPVPEISERTCIFSDILGQSVMRCTAPALENQDYCEDHVAEAAVV